MLPLQPMSMSIPITCQKNKLSEDIENYYPMLVTRILMSVNYKYIPMICEKSIKNVCEIYGIQADNATIQCIKMMLSSEQMSSTDLLALFFVLLNIDTKLKANMLQSETEIQKSKLCNFFMNLHKHLVPEFMAVNALNSMTFVQRCSDAWSVAWVGWNLPSRSRGNE